MKKKQGFNWGKKTKRLARKLKPIIERDLAPTNPDKQ